MTESSSSPAHLGQPDAVVKKKRTTLFVVAVISVIVHVLGLGAFAVIKIVDTVTQPPPEFEAVVETLEEPPPPPPPPTQRSTQRSMPRPEPMAARNPLNMTVPQIEINAGNLATGLTGRGSGGGLGDIGGGTLQQMAMANISFLGKQFEGETDRIMFIIDTSGSMVLGRRGIDGYKVVVDEIVKTLEGMTGSGSFNLIAFGGDIDTFRGSFTDVTETRIRHAQRWLMDLDPGIIARRAEAKGERPNFRGTIHHGTMVHLALEEAFKKRPNMIILLSDGDPTTKAQGGMDQKDIHELVAGLQSDPKIPINTISYKSTEGRAFLRKLAQDNNGEFTTID